MQPAAHRRGTVALSGAALRTAGGHSGPATVAPWAGSVIVRPKGSPVHRRTAATYLLGVVLAATGCTSSTGQAEGPVATSEAASTSAPPAAGSGLIEPVITACTDYADSSGASRAVLEQAEAGPVLGPFAALLLLDIREVATKGAAVGGEVRVEFSELVAAIDELVAQFDAALPEGALAVDTPVMVDGARLTAALDAVDATCTEVGVPPVSGTPPATP